MPKKLIAAAFALALVVPAFARAESPVNLALFNPIQITKETESVSAFRFSLIYGRNADMQGLDLSLVGRNTGDFTGGQLGFINIAGTMRSGLQPGLVNIINNKEKLKVFPIVNWKF